MKAGNQKNEEAEQNQKEIERQEKVRILYLAWFVRARIVLLRINIARFMQRGKARAEGLIH